MFNKNFLVSLKGNEVISIRQIDNKIKITVSDSWNYFHSDNRVFKESIQYGVKSCRGEDFNNEVYISFYSDMPLEGFDYHLPMIYGGVNLEGFCREIASTYIPGSWDTPKQIAYNQVISENYFIDRD